MKLNTLQKEKIHAEFLKIQKMDKPQLNYYVQQLYLMKQNMPDIVFKAIMMGVDGRNLDLMENTTVGFEVVMSELREGEV